MARPSKLIKRTADRLIEAISKGATYDLACKFAGISFQTFLNWRERAQSENSGMFVELFERLERAEGEAAARWLSVIDNAANEGDVKSAQWLLERRHGKLYGKAFT